MELEYFSASRLKTLHDCKKLFYNQYILKRERGDDGPFAALGTCIHAVLEEWRKDTTISRKGMVELFKKHWPLGADHFLYKEGVHVVQGLELTKLARGELVGCEYEFDGEFSGYHVKGVIDKVERIDGTLVITDYKSNKSVEPKDYLLQLSVYNLVAEELWPGEPKRYELYYLRFNQICQYTFDANARTVILGILGKTKKMVAESGDSSELWPRLDKISKTCSFCQFRSECWNK